jgi:hypothetical protein
MLRIHKCLRCSHDWPSRMERLSEVCPKCKSPYWNKEKWKGDIDMTQQKLLDLWGILNDLSVDCQKAIKPESCVLENTPQSSAFHFRVPNRSRRKIIAWGHLRPSSCRRLGANTSCATIGIYAGLLDINQPEFQDHYFPKASWGANGKGEIQFAIQEIGDSNYKLALKALTQAAKNVLAGK